MEYLLTIPGRLDNLNDYISAERSHRMKGAAMKENNESIVYNSILTQLRRVRIVNPVRMEYLWVEKNSRRDKDNISSFGRKVIQDALVKSHVLVNDDWKHVVGFSDDFTVDAGNPRIEVRIIEVGGE